LLYKVELKIGIFVLDAPMYSNNLVSPSHRLGYTRYDVMPDEFNSTAQQAEARKEFFDEAKELFRQ
jgi:hypothetical protein